MADQVIDHPPILQELRLWVPLNSLKLRGEIRKAGSYFISYSFSVHVEAKSELGQSYCMFLKLPET